VKKKSNRSLTNKSSLPQIRHSKSIDNLLLNLKSGGVFGYPLAFSLTTEEKFDIPKRKIPIALDLLLTLIEARKNEIEGDILVDSDYNSQKVIQYSEQFENGDFRIARDESVSVLCGLFKSYLRKLPEPLIPNLHYKTFIEIVTKHKNDPEEAIQGIKTLTRVQPEVNIIVTHRILIFLNNLTKSWWTSEEHEQKIRNEFVHYILRPRLGSIEQSGFNLPVGKELKKLMETYTFLVDNVYQIYGVLEDDGSTIFSDSYSDNLIIKKKRRTFTYEYSKSFWIKNTLFWQ